MTIEQEHTEETERKSQSWVFRGNPRAPDGIGRLSLLSTLSPTEGATLNTQVAAIRAEIKANGESIVDCSKLLVMCPEVAVSGQWGEIAKIAIREQWSFTFFPNGDVRFAPLA